MDTKEHNPNEPVQGLTEETAKVFDPISNLDCIKGLYLCSGTAQSLQMNHRLSEDLDFELIGTSRVRPKLDFHATITEIRDRFENTRLEILGDNHYEIYINNKVKLSFFRPANPVKYIHPGFVYNNIKTPSLQDLLGMKVFTTGVRFIFRDYYDIYCLLEKGCCLKDAVDYASYLSKHQDKSKSMYSRLLSPQLFPKDKDFERMRPRFDITPEQIARRIAQAIKDEALKPKLQTPKP